MTQAPHVMIDCETLALASNAAVWQVGWKDMSSDVHHVAYINPGEIQHHVQTGRLAEATGTIEWALKTYGAPSPFNRWYADYNGGQNNNGTHSIAELHRDMSSLIGPSTTVWAKGADFDFPILSHLFSLVGLPAPWHYRNKACMRTLKMLAELEATDAHLDTMQKMKNPDAHDAGADVVFQTEQVQYYLGILNVQL